MTHTRSINVGEVIAAFVVFCIGAFMVWEGSHYPIGALSRMGPGFFPVGIGVVLMILGVALVLEVMRLDTPPPDLRLRPFVMIGAGLLSFALLVQNLGLVPATLALVGLSALGDSPVRLRAMIGTAIVLTIIGYLVFLRGFGLQLDAIRW